MPTRPGVFMITASIETEGSDGAVADILHSRNSCRACVSRWRRTGAFPTARGGKALRKLIPRDDFGSRFTGAPVHQTYHAIWSVFASLCQNRRKVHLLTTALIPT